MHQHHPRRLALLLAVTAGLVLAGATATQSLAATAPSCSEGLTNVSCTGFPVDFVTVNDCTGEFVNILGFYHVVVGFTVNSDGSSTMKAYTNFQNASGKSLTTGTLYQANLTDHQYERLNPAGATIYERFDDNYELVSLSPTPNMVVHFVFHAKVDAFGVPSAAVDQVDAKCAGAGGSTPLT